MLALIRLLHCLNCNKEMRNHAVYANLLSCASLALASEELQQNLKNSIAGIQEIYSAVDNNWEDSGFVKYCFSEIVQCLWSLADTGTGKGKVHFNRIKINFIPYFVKGTFFRGDTVHVKIPLYIYYNKVFLNIVQ